MKTKTTATIVYVGNFIDAILEETLDKDYSDVETQLFKDNIYPTGHTTNVTAGEGNSDEEWLDNAIDAALRKASLTEVTITEDDSFA